MITVLFVLIVILTIALICVSKRIKATINSKVIGIYSDMSALNGRVIKNQSEMKECIESVNSDVQKLLLWKKNIEHADKKLEINTPAQEFLAQHPTEVTVVEEKIEDEDDEPANQSNKVEEVQMRRSEYARFREQGMDIHSAGFAVGVSITTARRYERWYKYNKS